MNDIVFMSNNLEKWVKDEGAPDIPLVNKLFFPKIRKDPMGAVLIIGSVGHVEMPDCHRCSC